MVTVEVSRTVVGDRTTTVVGTGKGVVRVIVLLCVSTKMMDDTFVIVVVSWDVAVVVDASTTVVGVVWTTVVGMGTAESITCVDTWVVVVGRNWTIVVGCTITVDVVYLVVLGGGST